MKPVRTLVLFFIAIILMVVLLITSFSLFFEKTTEKQLLRYGQMTLDSGALYLDTMMESAKDLVDNLSLDSDISLLLNYESLSASDLLTGLRRLYKYTSSNYLIDSIYVFNRKNNNVCVSSPHMSEAVYSLPNFPDFEAGSIIQDYMRFNNLEPIFRVYNAFYPLIQEIPYISFIRYNNLSRPNESNVILLNIRQDVLSNLINKDTEATGGLLLLIDSSGTSRIISGDETISSDSLISEMLGKLEGGEESFIARSDGHKYIVCSSEVLGNNARLVLVADEKIVASTTDTKSYAASIILIGLVFFLIAVALSLLFRRIWKIIESQFEAVQKKEEENRLLLETSRNGILLSFLHSEKKAEEIPLLSSVDGTVTLIIATIDYYETKLVEKLGNNFSRNKLKIDILDKFTNNLPNVIFTTYESDERCIISVQGKIDIEELSQVKYKIETDLSISLSLFISPECTLNNIPFNYDELCGGIPTRMLLGPSIIVDQISLHKQNNTKCSLADSKLKSLTERILQMDLDSTLTTLDEILDNISSASYNSAQKSLVNLFVSIDDAFTKLFSNNGIEKNVITGNLTYKLSKLEYLSEVRETIIGLMNSISEAVLQTKNNRQNELLSEITQIVQTSCFSRDFSINTVADQLGMSAAYLGKVFKKASGKSFSEYVLSQRMEAACRMLKETDMTIDEIVYSVGFGDTPYFYKLFKKLNGCTPVKYRQENKM